MSLPTFKVSVLIKFVFIKKVYCKSSIKPLGAYSIVEVLEGGLLKRGAYWRGGAYFINQDQGYISMVIKGVTNS